MFHLSVRRGVTSSLSTFPVLSSKSLRSCHFHIKEGGCLCPFRLLMTPCLPTNMFDSLRCSSVHFLQVLKQLFWYSAASEWSGPETHGNASWPFTNTGHVPASINRKITIRLILEKKKTLKKQTPTNNDRSNFPRFPSIFAGTLIIIE